MSQKSSLPQVIQSVSEALMPDTAELLNDADVQQQLDQIQMPTIELPSINP